MNTLSHDLINLCYQHFRASELSLLNYEFDTSDIYFDSFSYLARFKLACRNRYYPMILELINKFDLYLEFTAVLDGGRVELFDYYIDKIRRGVKLVYHQNRSCSAYKNWIARGPVYRDNTLYYNSIILYMFILCFQHNYTNLISILIDLYGNAPCTHPDISYWIGFNKLNYIPHERIQYLQGLIDGDHLDHLYRVVEPYELIKLSIYITDHCASNNQIQQLDILFDKVPFHDKLIERIYVKYPDLRLYAKARLNQLYGQNADIDLDKIFIIDIPQQIVISPLTLASENEILNMLYDKYENDSLSGFKNIIQNTSIVVSGYFYKSKFIERLLNGDNKNSSYVQIIYRYTYLNRRTLAKICMKYGVKPGRKTYNQLLHELMLITC